MFFSKSPFSLSPKNPQKSPSLVKGFALAGLLALAAMTNTACNQETASTKSTVDESPELSAPTNILAPSDSNTLAVADEEGTPRRIHTNVEEASDEVHAPSEGEGASEVLGLLR